MTSTPEVQSILLLEHWKDILDDDGYRAMLLTAHANRVSFLLRRRIAEHASEFGISQVDAVIMVLLHGLKKEPIQLKDIWRIYEYTPGAVTRRVAKLRNAKLVVTTTNAEDGRSVDVKLTSRGREVVEAVFKKVSIEWAKLIGDMGLSATGASQFDDAMYAFEKVAQSQNQLARDRAKPGVEKV